MLQEDFLKDVLKNEINDFTEDTSRTFHPIFSSADQNDFQRNAKRIQKSSHSTYTDPSLKRTIDTKQRIPQQ